MVELAVLLQLCSHSVDQAKGEAGAGVVFSTVYERMERS